MLFIFSLQVRKIQNIFQKNVNRSMFSEKLSPLCEWEISSWLMSWIVTGYRMSKNIRWFSSFSMNFVNSTLWTSLCTNYFFTYSLIMLFQRIRYWLLMLTFVVRVRNILRRAWEPRCLYFWYLNYNRTKHTSEVRKEADMVSGDEVST